MERWSERAVEPTTVIEVANGPIVREQLIDHVGFMADLNLNDGDTMSGVIVGVAGDALILELWDSTIRGPNGDLATVAFYGVSRVCIW
jgi:hypothetical protein